MNQTTPPRPRRTSSSSTAITTLASLLAQGVIRLHDRQKPLAEPTEERVHSGELVTRRRKK
jgi:hypothetical protein